MGRTAQERQSLVLIPHAMCRHTTQIGRTRVVELARARSNLKRIP